jgi:hypothetical protein
MSSSELKSPRRRGCLIMFQIPSIGFSAADFWTEIKNLKLTISFQDKLAQSHFRA